MLYHGCDFFVLFLSSFVCSFVCSFVRSFIRSFFLSFFLFFSKYVTCYTNMPFLKMRIGNKTFFFFFFFFFCIQTYVHVFLFATRVSCYLSFTSKLISARVHIFASDVTDHYRGARWLSGKVSDSGARGRGFETYRRRVVSLSKTLYSPKVLVNYPGSSASVPI